MTREEILEKAYPVELDTNTVCELLFKGKCSVTKEWVKGYYLQTLIGGKEVSVIVPNGAFDGMQISDKIYQVDPETVEQCTGLEDKNGVMIFGGDILRCGEYIYTVKYSRDLASFVLKTDYGIVYNMAKRSAKGYEIIGNIHDNPELLKGA